MMNRKFYTFIFTVLTVLFAAEVMAQVPQGFNFQAVARGTDGLPLTNQEIGVQINILQGTETGTVVYTETHTVTTSEVGLFQLVIGEGTPAESNDFTTVDWGSDNHFVKLAVDATGGTTYEDLGTTRLLSVPYALLAQDVVNGSGGTGAEGFDDLIVIDTDDVNLQDSLKILRLGSEAETELAYGVQIEASSTGRNRPLTATINELAANAASQYAISGTASGPGTGLHIGLLGTTWNPESTTGTRYGVYGQASSAAKYTYGVSGVAYGAGNGDEGTGYGEGSINFGLYGTAAENTWNNTGVEAQAFGDAGKWNFGVHGLSSAGLVDSVKNHGVAGRAFGPGINYGVYGSAWDGVENWAGYFDGAVQINGDLNVTGSINGGSGGGSATQYALDTSNPDSSFTVDLTGPVSGSAIIATSSTSGVNAGVEGKAISGAGNAELQVGTYGEADGEGTGSHLGVYGVATGPEAGGGDGGRRYGLYGFARSTGRENIGGFGIGRGAGDGEIVALGDEFAGGTFNVGGFNIGLVGFARDNVNGNIGIRGYAYGDQGSRENRAVSAEAVSTATGRNIGTQAIVHSSQTTNIGFQALMFDGGTGVSSQNNDGVTIDISNAASVMNRGILANINGTSPDNHGMQIDVSGGTNSNIGLIVNATTAAELNGDVTMGGNLVVNGNIEHTGSITQTSDRNLKENIQPLENGLATIMKLNPTTYNFRGNGEYNGLKLSTGLHYGLIAQEVEQVLPSLVKDNVHTYSESVSEAAGPNTANGDEVVKTMDYKTMNYTELIPVLIKAVQEQQAEIEALKKEVERLKSEKDK